ncbi:Cupredoxin superfamily protein [Klebsormidium nitens]|uniref:Cupredoxin superfamily protein n=1 Tax=Klebsormidium nitens TaxID=105231 RepID=A0A1Y1I665_KLENI|nr:Cupredoxin superfamily protein [Klebsormidium nitens]|eukprot:GAQ84217.1 Cupredoxin superfamily protein [Klebsormidium nitens]
MARATSLPSILVLAVLLTASTGLVYSTPNGKGAKHGETGSPARAPGPSTSRTRIPAPAPAPGPQPASPPTNSAPSVSPGSHSRAPVAPTPSTVAPGPIDPSNDVPISNEVRALFIGPGLVDFIDPPPKSSFIAPPSTTATSATDPVSAIGFWQQPLAFPERITTFDSRTFKQTIFNVTLGEFEVIGTLHPAIANSTALLAYGRSATTANLPGPTFEVLQGQPLFVTVVNKLPGNNTGSLANAIDYTLTFLPPPPGKGVFTSVHLHGGIQEPQSDGNPDVWFTNPDLCDYSTETCVGPLFNVSNKYLDPPGQKTHFYPNINPATLLFYHDHAFGVTRLNVYNGLLGHYIVRSQWELQNPALPKGKYEREMAIVDVLLNPDGSLDYPTMGVTPFHPKWVPETFGTFMTVNGKIWPFFEVERTTYRFRIVNGCQARFLNLRLVDPQSTGERIGNTSVLPFVQIGAEQGFLPAPAVLDTILMGNAERADVLIDFSRMPVGAEIIMSNDAAAPFPDGPAPVFGVNGTASVLKFIVVAHDARAGPTRGVPDRRAVGKFVPPAAMAAAPPVTKTRPLLLLENLTPSGATIQLTLNGLPYRSPLTGAPIVTELPAQGTTELWEMFNPTADSHPIHTHLVGFQVLNRQPYNTTSPPTSPVFTGPPEPPAPNETGMKDTVKVPPGFVTRILITFARPGWIPGQGPPFPFDPTPQPGYVWHCHILNHEDNDMMRPYFLIDPPTFVKLKGRVQKTSSFLRLVH